MAPTVIYTLSLHDALPIFADHRPIALRQVDEEGKVTAGNERRRSRVTFPDRKSTRLNSSHQIISYAVFCLKKKRILRRAGDLRAEPADAVLDGTRRAVGVV